MSDVTVTPIPITPGSVATGSSYTPDSQNNYITIPEVSVAANLSIASQTFVAKYTPTTAGRTVSHATATIVAFSFSMSGNKGILNLTFYGQVFFTDNTNDLISIDASIEIAKPTDFSTFNIVGPFLPVVPNNGVTAAYDSTITTQINISIKLNAFTLPVSGNASVKVQVATGTF